MKETAGVTKSRCFQKEMWSIIANENPGQYTEELLNLRGILLSVCEPGITDTLVNSIVAQIPSARQLPTVSAIIPTKGRAKDLHNTVKSVLCQTVLPLQLIIIDQNKDSETRRGVEEMYANIPDSVRDALQLVYISDPGITGPAAARNRGMDVASGEVWLFLDDDVTLEPDFIAALLHIYGSHPGVAGVSGIITNYRPPPALLRLWSTIFLRGPFRDERQPIYWRAEQLRESQPLPVAKFTGACMSFCAAAIRRLRFDETLRSAYEEDAEFCFQLGPRALLVIAPRARLAHHRSLGGRSGEHHLKREARATYYLYKKYWRVGPKNRLCFAWLNIGYVLMAALASAVRLRTDPWRAVFSGVREAKLILSQSVSDRGNFHKIEQNVARQVGKDRDADL